LGLAAVSGILVAESRLAVLLLAYGGPERLEDVPDFLARVVGPRPLSEAMIDQARERYRAIGGGSPLVANSRVQAAALEAALNVPGAPQARVFLGMRHSPPALQEALDAALEFGGGRSVGVLLASHQSVTATGGYRRDLEVALAARAARGVEPGRVVMVAPWHVSPLFLDAVADRARESLGRLAAQTSTPGAAEEPPLIVFTAHSVPVSGGDPQYEQGLAATAAGVIERLGALPWRLAYQSRSSRPGMEWLGPDVEDVLREEAAAGHRWSARSARPSRVPR
jgi:ferrochelatase